MDQKPATQPFRARFMARFHDPAFRAEDAALARLEAIAWEAYSEGRKSPLTSKAGAGYANPDYALSTQWRETRERVDAAGQRQRERSTPSRAK